MSTELLTSLGKIALRFSPMRCLLAVVLRVLTADVSFACLCLPSQSAADDLNRANAVEFRPEGDKLFAVLNRRVLIERPYGSALLTKEL